MNEPQSLSVYVRALDKDGLHVLAELSRRRNEIRERWFKDAESLEEYAVLEAWVGELASVTERMEAELPQVKPELLPRAYAWLGHLLSVSGSQARASTMLAEAEVRCDSEWLRARITLDRGVIALTERLSQIAERELLLAQSLFEACGDLLSASDAAIHLARCYSGQGKSSEALEILSTQLESCPSGGLLQLRALLELARTHLDRFDVDRAEALNDEAAAIAPPNVFEVQYRLLWHRSELAWWRESWVDARLRFAELTSLCESASRRVHLAYSTHAFAALEFDAGDFSRALTLTREALRMAQALDAAPLVFTASLLEASALVSLGERDAAIKIYRSLRPSNSVTTHARIAVGHCAMTELLLAAHARSESEAAAFDAAAKANIAALAERTEHGVRWAESTFALRVLSRRVQAYAAPRNLAHLLTVKPKPLAVDPSTGSISLDTGERITVAHRPVLARVLKCLAQHASTRPGQPVTLDELLAAGWPKDRATRASLVGRLRVAVATLRQLALEDVLVTHEQGYSLNL